MKPMRWILVGVLLIGIFTIGIFTWNKKAYVAKINGEKISEDELNEVLVSNYGSDILQSLVNEKVTEMEMEKMKVKIPKKEIENEMEKYKEEYGGEDTFEEALEASGMKMADLEKKIKNYLAVKELMKDRINITEEEMKDYFSKNKDQFDQKEEVQASHILVEDEETAKKIIKRLEKGENFAELAKEYSTDEMTSKSGGELDPFGKGEKVKEFEKVAFSMKAGEISDPVKTKYGYHIIKVEGKTKAKKADFEESKDDIQSMLFDSKMNNEYSTWLEEIKEDYDIEYLLDQ